MADEQPGALTDDALIGILRKEEQAAANWNTDTLQTTRTDALNAYDRQPYGTEQEGQSKVVTSEFADTVESVMPSLMRVFASGEDIVEFQPDSPADEIAADEASEYIPHVIMRENPGFTSIYWFVKDSLMSRVGVWTVDVEEREETTEQPVTGWTAEQIAMAPGLAEEAGQSIELEVTEDEAPEPQLATDTDGNPVRPLGGEPLYAPPPQPTFSGTVKATAKRKYVCIDNIAPEDVMITPDSRDVDSASFVGYRKRVTSSDLRMLGVPQEEIDQLSSDRTQSPEQSDRDPSSQTGRAVRDNRGDSERPLWLVRAYVKADSNGDGISERLNVLYAHAGGAAGRIIERLDWDEPEVPITIGSPILMPHTLVGRSLFDQVSDLQEISTALTRGMLDNVYFTNRPRPTINSQNVDINMLLDWTPGMPIPVKGAPGDNVGWLQVPSIIDKAIAALEYTNTVKERRTGITSYNQGLDAESLNKTLGGIDRIMSAAQQRMELIARVFAETAVKRLCRHVYRAVKRCATGEIEYGGGSDREWKRCDPTKWPSDMDLSVNVGGATGNKQQEMQNLMLIGQGQKALIEAQGGTQGPLVTQEHIANTFRKLCEAAGYKGTQEFVASGKEVATARAQQGQQQKPSPEVQKAMADAQVKQMSAQADIQLEREKAAAEIQLTRERAAAELQIIREKAAAEMQIKREMAQLDAELKARELDRETALKAASIAAQPAPNIEQQQLNG